MSTQTTRGPSAPTRSTEQIQISDRFQTQVYYAKAIKRFAILDSQAKPRPSCWVAVRYLTAGRIQVQRFTGQPHFGVVRFLKIFELVLAGITFMILCLM